MKNFEQINQPAIVANMRNAQSKDIVKNQLFTKPP